MFVLSSCCYDLKFVETILFFRVKLLSIGILESSNIMVHLIMQDTIHSISIYSTNIKIEFHIVWHPAPPSFYKLNVNGYHNTATSSTNCGSLIRESFSNIINRFHYNLETSNVIKGGAQEGLIVGLTITYDGRWEMDHLFTII